MIPKVKPVKSSISGMVTAAFAVVAASLVLVAVEPSGQGRIAACAIGCAADLAVMAWIGKWLGRERKRVLASQESLARSTAIIEGSDDPIISKDLDGVIRSWNAGATRVFGYEEREAIGRPITIIVPPERLDEERQILARVANGERIERFETFRRRKDGSLVEVMVSVSPVRDASGAVIGASKIAHELTRERSAANEKRAAIRELGDIKMALDEHSIVAITDASGKITSVNGRFCAISKYSREELLGKDHRVINSGYHPKEFFAELWSTIKAGKTWRGEIRNRAKDGTIYWVETTIFPRVNEEGEPIQYIAIRTDITRRKEDEDIIRRSASELLEKNKELETIVYSVSHDLRSPLLNVQGFSRQLGRACDKLRQLATSAEGGSVPAPMLIDAVDQSIPQALRFIDAGVKKMDVLLAGLLRYSRLGRVVMAPVPLDMNALLSEIISATRFQLNEARAQIVVEPLPRCLADSVQTSQVFANLIDNAIKYRDTNRPLKISVSGLIKEGVALYSLADNGIGIAPEHQHKIFEIFHRLNPEAQQGDGLGLTIAQRVLERQGGKIWVESKLGSGSTFHISLPAVKA